MKKISLLKKITKYSLMAAVILVLEGCANLSQDELAKLMDNNAYVAASEDEPSIAQADEELATNESQQEEEMEIEEGPSIEELMVPFDIENAYSYCKNVRCTVDDEKKLVSFYIDFDDAIPESDDENIYLFEFSTFENEDLDEKKKPVASCDKAKEVNVKVMYKDRYLFSRFVPAILFEGNYVALYDGQYISNPEILAENNQEYLEISSKKGILLDANTIDKDELYDLNVKRAVYNVPLSFIIGETGNETVPTIEYEYNGQVYHFNGYLCGGFDSLFSYLTEQGIHSTVIILNDWNDEHLEIVHPKSRKKTGKSLYYAFNTEEEEGVRLMEATAMFLADRYSGKEHGLVYDWVIANEINQQTIWNYMDTDDIDYYTQSFEKSFRTFYNAIKSKYSNARVYFSVDHDWNDNYGNNRRFFNVRDLLYKFNECAIKGGNYDWNLSIHPYPDPLPRVKFWKGDFDKTEEARVVTPMNLSVVTDFMQKEEFLNSSGNIRDIGITELGFSSVTSEKLQAAAFAYCYYIIEDNEYISSFLMNRQTDDAGALKSGLRLGIYNYDYSPKLIKEVFSNVDDKEWTDFIPEMLEIIGAETLEEALERAR